MGISENKSAIRDFVETCINGRDLDRLEEFFAPDFIDHTAPPELANGIPGRRAWLNEALATFPDLHAVVEAQVGEGEMVASRVTSSGTINGQKMTTGIASFDRVVDGHIVEKWEFRDPDLTARFERISETSAAVTVKRYVSDVWNAGDSALLGELVTADHLRHQPDCDVVGIDALWSTISALRVGFPDLHFDAAVTPANDGGKTITRRWVMTGTHEGEYAGIAPTGRAIKSTGIAVSRLERGKIAEEWISRDDLGLLAQLSE